MPFGYKKGDVEERDRGIMEYWSYFKIPLNTISMKQKIFQILDELGIKYTNYEHLPVHSCADAKGIDVPGKRVKSLLLRNKKATNFYMVVLGDNKQLEVNTVRYFFEDTKLSFASTERMMQKIGVEPGHVSPYALINNSEKDIKVLFDAELKGVEIGFHPLQNDNTVVSNMDDIEKFLDHLGIEYFYTEL